MRKIPLRVYNSSCINVNSNKVMRFIGLPFAKLRTFLVESFEVLNEKSPNIFAKISFLFEMSDKSPNFTPQNEKKHTLYGRKEEKEAFPPPF